MMDKKINFDINYINPFLVGASMVFNTLLKIELRKGKIKIVSLPKPTHDVVIKVDITGNASGFVIYSLGFYTVNKIAEVLVPGLSEEQIQSEYKDIMGEIANMITGNALNVLANTGLDISTPRVMHRSEFAMPSPGKLAVLALKLYSPYGQLEITVVLKPSPK